MAYEDHLLRQEITTRARNSRQGGRRTEEAYPVRGQGEDTFDWRSNGMFTDQTGKSIIGIDAVIGVMLT